MKEQQLTDSQARVMAGVDEAGENGLDETTVIRKYTGAIRQLIERNLITRRDNRLYITTAGRAAIGLEPEDWQKERYRMDILVTTTTTYRAYARAFTPGEATQTIHAAVEQNGVGSCQLFSKPVTPDRLTFKTVVNISDQPQVTEELLYEIGDGS